MELDTLLAGLGRATGWIMLHWHILAGLAVAWIVILLLRGRGGSA
jgi:hypothetical protein